MSNSLPVPATRLRDPQYAAYAKPVRHWSVALRYTPGLPGRAGPSCCGTIEVSDQARVNALLGNTRLRIDTLRACQRCLAYVRRVTGLKPEEEPLMNPYFNDLLRTLLEDVGLSRAWLSRVVGCPSSALRLLQQGLPTRLSAAEISDVDRRLRDVLVMLTQMSRHAGQDAAGPDQAAFFEGALINGYRVRGRHLYTFGDGVRCAELDQHNGLCDLARGERVEHVLDRHIPDWRTRYWSDYVIVTAGDGYPSIMLKPANGERG